jgi:hypothetical protein
MTHMDGIEELETRVYDLGDARQSLSAEAYELYYELLDMVWNDLEVIYERTLFSDDDPDPGQPRRYVRPNPQEVKKMHDLMKVCRLIDLVLPDDRDSDVRPGFMLGGDLCCRRIKDIVRYLVMQMASVGMDDDTLAACLGHVLEPWLAVRHIMKERADAKRGGEELRSWALAEIAADGAASSEE